MDLFTFLVISGIFTVFGYVWGKSTTSRSEVIRIVSTTMEKLEEEGYLRSETVQGHVCYVKWPDQKDQSNEN